MDLHSRISLLETDRTDENIEVLSLCTDHASFTVIGKQLKTSTPLSPGCFLIITTKTNRGISEV